MGNSSSSQQHQEQWQQPPPNYEASNTAYQNHSQTPHQQPQHSSLISSPPNTKPLVFCKKVHEKNGCGHKERITYVFCERTHIHPDQPVWNEWCWKQRLWPSTSKTVYTGDSFCHSACQAWVRGWICCQCNSWVKGKLSSNILEHDAGNGVKHAFCRYCRVDYQQPVLTQSVNPAPTNTFNMNYYGATMNVASPHLL